MRILQTMCAVLMVVALRAFALDAPQNVQASDGLFTDKIALTWDAVPGASGYLLTRTGALSSQTDKFEIVVPGTSYADLTPDAGVVYTYRVRAMDATGATSGFSAYETGWRKIFLVNGSANYGCAVPPAGGAERTQLQVNCNTSWVATTEDDWIQLDASTAVNAGTTNVVFAVLPNETGRIRQGTVKITARGGSTISYYVVQGTVGAADLTLADILHAKLPYDGGTRTEDIRVVNENVGTTGFVAVPDEGDVPCLRNGPMTRGGSAVLSLVLREVGELSFNWKRDSSAMIGDKFEVFTNTVNRLPSLPALTCTATSWKKEKFLSSGVLYVWFRVAKDAAHGSALASAGGGYLANVNFTGTPVKLEIVETPEFVNAGEKKPIICRLTDSLGIVQSVRPTKWEALEISAGGTYPYTPAPVRYGAPADYDLIYESARGTVRGAGRFVLQATYTAALPSGGTKSVTAASAPFLIYPNIYYALDANLRDEHGNTSYMQSLTTSGAGWRWQKLVGAVEDDCAVSTGGGTDPFDDLTFPVASDGRVTLALKMDNPASDSRFEFYVGDACVLTVPGTECPAWRDYSFEVTAPAGAEVACRFIAGKGAGSAQAALDNLRFQPNPGSPRDVTCLWSYDGQVGLGWNHPTNTLMLTQGYRVTMYPAGTACPDKPTRVEEMRYEKGDFAQTCTLSGAAGDYIVRIQSYGTDTELLSAPVEIPVTIVAEGGPALFPSGDLVLSTDAGTAAWQLTPAKPFTGADGTTSYQVLRSGPINHGKASALRTSFTGPGTLTLWCATSSEEDFDILHVFIDGQDEGELSGTDAEWVPFTWDLGQGPHELELRYEKDGSVSHGDDCAYLGAIAWEPVVFLGRVELEGPDSLITGGDAGLYQVYGCYSNATEEIRLPLREAKWSTSSFDSSVTDQLLAVNNPDTGSYLVSVRETLAGVAMVTVQAEVVVEGQSFRPSTSVMLEKITFAEAVEAPNLAFLVQTPGSWRISTELAAVGNSSVCACRAWGASWGDSLFSAAVNGPGTLSFRWRHAGADGEYGSTEGRFYVDGGSDPVETIAGETDWETVTCTVTGSGVHTFVWDFFSNNGAETERLWIDAVTWTPDTSIAWRFLRGEIVGKSTVIGGADYQVEATFLTPSGERTVFVDDVRWRFDEGEWYGNNSIWHGEISVYNRQPHADQVDGVMHASFVLNDGSYEVQKAVSLPSISSLRKAVLDSDQAWIFELSGDFIGQDKDRYVGATAARSPNHQDESSSKINCVVYGGGLISFIWRVSSEDGCDELTFSVDGREIDSISGTERGWQQISYRIPDDGDDPAKRHYLQWSYVKDISLSEGEDAGWVDDIQWKGSYTPGVTGGYVVSEARNGDAVWAGSTVASTVEFWLTNGIGTREQVIPVSWSFVTTHPELRSYYSEEIDEQGRYMLTVSPDLPKEDQIALKATFRTASGDTVESLMEEIPVRLPISLNVALDNAEATFTMKGAGLWVGQDGRFNVGGSAVCLVATGAMPQGQVYFENPPVESSLSMKVNGPGRLSFDKLLQSSHGDLQLLVDGQDQEIGMGWDGDWVNCAVDVRGSGDHTITWRYKASQGDAHAFVGLDNVQWTGEYATGKEETSKGVPYAWLTEMGIAAGGDAWETSENARAANGVNAIWECYVANLDPRDPTAALRITELACVDGTWHVAYVPAEPRRGTFVVEGKVRYEDAAWLFPVTPACRFFRVVWKEGEE